ncbi:zf-HC2 domain-containing protein [Streptomyces sp. NBC_01275]|uniref:zf-HC2 domain-containing protein n=1 Tax=Streptomyces sp. NBC_01275 TaxID=2903807 RepID=UPI002252E2BF|nr:zf-HC2 domain-containing protein [Streptomyces sp. NBC_01275]MCX4762202.1 zf-HC2 domain-containing protein [Streptomyces sp. NBC_01275]
MSSGENWHASYDLAARYADGSLPEADAWSLEKHLERCGGCAERVSRAVRENSAVGVVLAEVRGAVLAEVLVPTAASTAVSASVSASTSTAASTSSSAAPATGPASAPATASPLLPRLPRLLWAAGPAVRGAWLPAVLFVALGAVGLAHVAGVDGVRPLLLAFAPVVPVAGVALSYGRYADPLYEIAAATPAGGLRLMLTRTAAVLAVSLPSLTLAGLLLPASGAPGAAAWLLPGLALTLGSLALAGYVGCRAATAVIGGGWLGVVLVPALTARGDRPLVQLADQLDRCLDGPLVQSSWAAAAVLCAVLLAARRSAYDRLLDR